MIIDTTANRQERINSRTDERSGIIWRNKELKDTDYIVSLMDFTPHQDWITYRQELRDWTEADSFPNIRPIKPDQPTPTGY